MSEIDNSHDEKQKAWLVQIKNLEWQIIQQLF